LGEETVERSTKTLGIHVKMFKGLWESRFLLFKQKMLIMESKKEHSHFMERANAHIGGKSPN